MEAMEPKVEAKERIGRNDPCPCGSGKKVKFCCGEKEAREEPASRSTWTIAGLVVVALVVGFAVASQLGDSEPAATGAAVPYSPPLTPRSAPVTTTAGAGSPFVPPPGAAAAPSSQPPGPAPEGKVWSEEHGHWHDVTVTVGEPVFDPGAAAAGPAQPAAAVAKTPQPPGEAPEGKVWSEEHGHWHDAPPTPVEPVPPSPVEPVPPAPVDPAPPAPEDPAPPPPDEPDPE